MTNETIRQKIREKLQRVNVRMESKAKDDAKKLGLDYMSFGRWGKDGKVTHKTKNGKLVALSPKDAKKATNTEPSDPNQMIGPKSKVNPAPDHIRQINAPINRIYTDDNQYDVVKERPDGFVVKTSDGKTEFIPEDEVEVVQRSDKETSVKHKNASRQLPGMIKAMIKKNPGASISIEPSADGFSIRAKPVEQGQPKKVTIDIGPVSVDPRDGQATLNGMPLALSKTESKLLTYLAGNQNKVISRGTLLDKVWGAAPDVQTRTVDMHIARLKKRLGNSGQMIQNVRGMGYRIVPTDTNFDPLGPLPGLETDPSKIDPENDW